MINPKEVLFVVDENDNPLTPLPRKEVHAKGLWHRTCGIWVVNKKGQILCQKRSLAKDVHPGLWEAFFGGHVLAGVEYLDSALTELKEELGISAPVKELHPYKVFKNNITHIEFHKVFAFLLVNPPEQFTFEKEEIDEIKWMDREEVEKILSSDDPNWVHEYWDTEVLEWLKTLK